MMALFVGGPADGKYLEVGPYLEEYFWWMEPPSYEARFGGTLVSWTCHTYKVVTDGRFYRYEHVPDRARSARKETQMHSYMYEVLVPEVSHFDQKTGQLVIDRPAKKIAAEFGVWPKPTRAELLAKHEAALREAGVDFGHVEEVIVNVVPFPEK